MQCFICYILLTPHLRLFDAKPPASATLPCLFPSLVKPLAARARLPCLATSTTTPRDAGRRWRKVFLAGSKIKTPP